VPNDHLLYDIVVRVEDNRDALVDFPFFLTARRNTTPVLRRANDDQMLASGAFVDVDAWGGNTVFSDAAGDPLTYRSELPRALDSPACKAFIPTKVPVVARRLIDEVHLPNLPRMSAAVLVQERRVDCAAERCENAR